MRRLAALAVVLLTVSGCARGVTMSEAFGTPDIDWTYFRATPAEVIAATDRALAFGGARLEAVQEVEGGTVMTLSLRGGSAATTEVFLEATDAEDYQARAQVYGRDRRLSRDLELAIRRQL